MYAKLTNRNAPMLVNLNVVHGFFARDNITYLVTGNDSEPVPLEESFDDIEILLSSKRLVVR
jgi:hypothetical protein